MVFVSVYKKKTAAGHDFVVLLYYKSIMQVRFGQKMMCGDKEIDCSREEEAVSMKPFMVLWWIDNDKHEMRYGNTWRIPEADRLFTEHLTPRWMLSSDIYSALSMITLCDFSHDTHMGLLTFGLLTHGFKRIRDDAECKTDYERVVGARTHATVIREEEELHAAVLRVIDRCKDDSRYFRLWSSLHNPPQIRLMELH